MEKLVLKTLVLLMFCPFQILQAKSTKEISENLSLSFSVSSAPCTGSNVDLTVQGGNSPYQFTWSNGITTEDLAGVNPGKYSVTVVDNFGLTGTGEVTVSGDSVFAISALVNDVTCPRSRDGSAKIVVKGGVAPFTYLWSNGSTASEITNSSGANLTVTVTDAIGCSKTIDVNISAPPRFGFHVTQQDATCADGTDGFINVVASGGAAPYKYLWNTGDTASSIYNLSPGTYTMTLTDRRKCTVIIDETIFSPDPIAVDTTTSVNCDGGNIDVTVSGGTPPYSFLWSTGATTEDLTKLAAGTYSLQVTDSKGCQSKPVNVVIRNFAPFKYEAVVKDVTCFGMNNGSVSINVISGTGPYYFVWSNGKTGSTISSLAPGAYSVNITDGNGCNNAVNKTVNEPEVLHSEITVTGFNADLQVSGGVAPYNYLWSNGSTNEDLVNVPNGTYTVKVMDMNNCFSSDKAVINLTLNASIDCCMDKYINSGESVVIPVNFSMPGPYVLKYKEIYDHKTSAVKTVTTSDNPYLIKATLTSTTSYELVSVTKGSVTGTVCGRATIGVNNLVGNCASNCFSAEVKSITTNGNCKTFTLQVFNNGHCRYGLSHLVVSVPCGTIQSVSSTRNFPVVYGMDPTTEINGFKLDNVNNFGEIKDGVVESFMLTYTLCTGNSMCPVPSCAPMMSFKAGQCVVYIKATIPDAARMAQNVNDESENFENVFIYPNPIEAGQAMNIKLPSNTSDDKVSVTMTNMYGMETYSFEIENADHDREIHLDNMSTISPGLYLITIKSGNQLHKSKLIVR